MIFVLRAHAHVCSRVFPDQSRFSSGTVACGGCGHHGESDSGFYLLRACALVRWIMAVTKLFFLVSYACALVRWIIVVTKLSF